MAGGLSAREILERLVAFPTVSENSNLALIDWVEEYLAGYGVKAHRVWNEARTHAALFANVGPEVPGGVVLSGHSDVVPVEGQAWSSDPFTLTERAGRLYGRGTCDMKGFVALALAAVPRALEAGLKRPLQIALSYDEEVGCTGAPPMIDEMVRTLPRAELVIVGEPSMMQVVTAHKAMAGASVLVKGHEVHSSLLPQGVSAVMEGARLIDWANRMNEEIQGRPPEGPAALFEPPFTTLHVGTVSGGTAQNITAKECRFGLEFRCVPGDPPEGWLERLRQEAGALDAALGARHPEAGVELDVWPTVPALAPEEDGAAEALARRLTGDNGTHAVSYATEAGQFQERGYSVVVCGPGDIAQAHQGDEFIAIEQLQAGEQFLRRLIDHLTKE